MKHNKMTKGIWAWCSKMAAEGRYITLDGLAKDLGLPSASAASYHIDKLVCLGYLGRDYVPGSSIAHGIRVLVSLFERPKVQLLPYPLLEPADYAARRN